MYIFDLDGTLVDSVEAHVEAWREAARRFGRPISREEMRALIGLPAPKIAEIIAGPRASELMELKKRLFLEDYISLVKPFEDVEALASLRRPIAVVTSSNAVLARAVLERTGLSRYVDFLLGGDEVPKGKPNPDPLYVVASRFGVSPRDMIVVGDTQYDVEMALSAGAVPVCISRDGRICKDGIIHIKSLYELLNKKLFP